MSRRVERAGILSSRTDALVCAVGVAIALVGLLAIALPLARAGALSSVLSSASTETPVAAFCLTALGACLALLGVRERQPLLTWALGVIASVVAAVCAAQVLGISISPQITAAWDLARGSESTSFASVLLRADLWLLVGAALVLLSLASDKLAEAATRACALFVVVTIAFLMTMVGATNASEGTSVGEIVIAVFIGLTAHACAVGVLRAREEESRLLTNVASWLPLAPVASIAAIAGTWVWTPQSPVSPPVAVCLALFLYFGAALAVASMRLARLGRAVDASNVRAADLTAIGRATEDADGHGTWRFQLGTEEAEISDRAAAILGRSSNIVARASLGQGVHPEDATAMQRWLDGLADAKGATSVVVRTSGPRGEERWLEFTGAFTPGSSQVCGTVRDVTESERAKERLRETVTLLKGVAATVPDVDFVYDIRKARYDYMNRPLGQLFGVAKEVTGTFIEDHIYPEDAKRFLEHVRTVNSSNTDSVHEVDYRVVRDDGGVMWIRSRASVFQRDADGTPTMVFGTVQDVTETKEAARSLEEAKAQLERVSSQSPGVIYRLAQSPSGEMSFPYMSEAAAQILGVSSEEIKRSPERAFALVHPDDLAGLYERIELSARTMTDFAWVGRVLKNGGPTLWVQANSRPSRLEDGTIVWDGVAIDVTAIKEAGIALQRTNDRMDQLLSQSPTVIYDCSPEPPYVLTTVASNVRALLGLYADQVVGRSLFATGLILAEDEETLKSHKRRFTDHGSSSAEYRMKTVSGDYVWVHDDVRIVSHETGIAEVVGAWTDVTAQKLAMQRLIESESRYQRTAASVPGMVFELLLHEDGRPEFTYVSPGSFALTGLAPQEIIARPESFLRMIDTEDKTRLYRELVRTQMVLGDLTWEGALTTASRTTIRIRLSAKFGGSGDVPASWAGIATDVSEERALTEDLAASHALLGDLLSSVSDAVIEVDANGRITGANENVEKVLGYRSLDLVGLDVGVLVPDEQREKHGEMFAGFSSDAPSNVVGKRREVMAKHKSGALVPITVTVFLAAKKGETMFVGILRRAEASERREQEVDLVAEPTTATRPQSPFEGEPAPQANATLPKEAARIELLVVASESEAQRLLLQEPGPWREFSVTIATSIGLGLELAKKRRPDVLLLASQGNVHFLQGVLEAVRTDEDLARVPVVVLDRTVGREARDRLVRSGATRVLDEAEARQGLSDLIGAVARQWL